MTLLIILASVFLVVALMVILGERYAKPMTEKQSGQFNKIIPILVFVMIIAAIIKSML